MIVVLLLRSALFWVMIRVLYPLTVEYESLKMNMGLKTRGKSGAFGALFVTIVLC